MKKISLVVISILSLRTCLGQSGELPVDSAKIIFNAKAKIINESFVSMDIKSKDDLRMAFSYIDTSFSIKYLESKGFDQWRTTHCLFLSIEGNVIDLAGFLRTGAFPPKKDSVSSSCKYVVACLINANNYHYYKLKGFKVNELPIFIADLETFFYRRKNEFKNSKIFLQDFFVEEIDFECLFQAWKSKKADGYYPCLNACTYENTIWLPTFKSNKPSRNFDPRVIKMGKFIHEKID